MIDTDTFIAVYRVCVDRAKVAYSNINVSMNMTAFGKHTFPVSSSLTQIQFRESEANRFGKLLASRDD